MVSERARNIIFYFSGTGNSLFAAKQIAAALGRGKTEVRAMTDPSERVGSFRRVGFVFPCYSFGLPRFVERFIKSLDLSELKADYWFSVETYGGLPIGASNETIDNILRSKGGRLDYGVGVRMFANYIALYPMIGNAARQARAARVRVARVAADIKAGRRRFFNPNDKIAQIKIKLHKRSLPMLLQKGDGLNVSADCVGCGLCIRLCPVGNIKAAGGKPVFGGRCEQCMACIQWCPKEAINFKDVTKNRRRYHHPGIRVGELAGSDKGNGNEK